MRAQILISREVIAFEIGPLAIVAVQGYRRWVIHLHYRHKHSQFVLRRAR